MGAQVRPSGREPIDRDQIPKNVEALSISIAEDTPVIEVVAPVSIEHVQIAFRTAQLTNICRLGNIEVHALGSVASGWRIA